MLSRGGGDRPHLARLCLQLAGLARDVGVIGIDQVVFVAEDTFWTWWYVRAS
jgi:hypothetical protein